MDRVPNTISPDHGIGNGIQSTGAQDPGSTIPECQPSGQQTKTMANGNNILEEDTPFKLGSFSIDEYRPLKVAIIGAGFSGITAGIRSIYFLFLLPHIQLQL